ncbi:MAG: VWA domain-containing protein [Terriglobia bacterium]
MKRRSTDTHVAHQHLLRCLAAVAVPTFALFLAAGQDSNPSGNNAAQNPNPPEMTTEEKQPSYQFRVERNLVLVRVVVRDSKGKPAGNLTKENFRLLDNGKPQTISEFTVERRPEGAGGGAKPSTTATPAGPGQPEANPAAHVADRFVAMYFDDVHLPFEDVARTRNAAQKFLDTSLGPGDRVGIFTSSGQGNLDFTADREKLRATLLRLQPRPITTTSVQECPDIFPYQAYLIVQASDQMALQAAVEDVISCQCSGNAQQCTGAASEAQAAANRVLNLDQDQSEYSLREIELLVRRMATLPGQRSIVWVSPGFMTHQLEFRLSEIIDRALRSNVIINGLDSRGLYTVDPAGDISKSANPAMFGNPAVAGYLVSMRLAEAQTNSDVLAAVAAGTGGTFFEHSNDLDEGFRRVGAVPDAAYVLGFSPANLKPDGKFHSLKVQVVAAPGLSAQARKGYFAPRELPDAKAQADEEIQEAVFSRDEMRELPMDFHTQFFKVNDREVQLSVLTRLDLRALHFRKQDLRNLDDVRIVAAVFDLDGNIVSTQEKVLEMHLRDTTLDRLRSTGVTLKEEFKVAPGTYVVRVVARDSEGKQLSGTNKTVEIPY